MSKKLTQNEFNHCLHNIIARQNQLAANSNFCITGFDAAKFGSLLQAFAEEFGLVEIVSEELTKEDKNHE